MPKFALMFKSLLDNKEKLFDLAITLVNKNCSVVILKKLPEKLGNPGKFLIPCDFPELDECLALAYLGASINLMPLSIGRKLSLPEISSTQMILELADRSTTRPAGIAKDVFEKTLFEDQTSLIDVYGEELTLCVDVEAITFNVGQTSKYSYNDAESINRINVIDVACEEYVQETEDLKQVDSTMTKTSIEEPPELELKELPSYLEYAFLEGTDKLPVRISKELKDEEKSALLKVLKLHKRAIG
nr:reverse transcriptase domain-containing protein [Tanacetum cinerariifolium]